MYGARNHLVELEQHYINCNIIHVQVFDILPLHGSLNPGEVQPVEFKFFGHAEINTDVTAACKVEGGPVYQIRIQGEASKMRHSFSERTLDLGLVMYDQIHTTHVTLHNKGKVNFNFSVLTEDKEEISPWQPGDLTVQPMSGRLLALESVEFTITYLPGVPEDFTKLVRFQVAHFPVDTVRVIGKAIYPKMSVNLEQDFSQVPADLLVEATNAMQKKKLKAKGGSGRRSLVVSDQELLANELETVLIKDFVNANASKLFIKIGKHRKPKYVQEKYECISYHGLYVLVGMV